MKILKPDSSIHFSVARFIHHSAKNLTFSDRFMIIYMKQLDWWKMCKETNEHKWHKIHIQFTWNENGRSWKQAA